jgi:hypothetical protein
MVVALDGSGWLPHAMTATVVRFAALLWVS